MNKNKEQFELDLDKALERLDAGEAPESIVQDYSESSDEILLMLKRADVLKNAEAPKILNDDAALMSIISKLIREPEVEQEPEKKTVLKPSLPFKRVFFKLAASVVFLFCIAWSSIELSADTIPGDFLYPLKIFTERVRFALSLNQEKKFELRLTFSSERLKEFIKKYKSERGIDKQLVKTMLDEAQAALKDSNELEEHIKPVMIQRVKSLSELQKKALMDVKNNVIASEKQFLNQSIKKCDKIMESCCCNKRQMQCDCAR